MKKPIVAGIVSVFLLTSFAAVANADGPGTRSPGVSDRQHHQHHRIKQGVRSGQLTRGEIKDIRKQQQQIRLEKREFKSDGELTLAERKSLHRDLNAASKDIYQEKHDDEVRPRAQP